MKILQWKFTNFRWSQIRVKHHSGDWWYNDSKTMIHKNRVFSFLLWKQGDYGFDPVGHKFISVAAARWYRKNVRQRFLEFTDTRYVGSQ